MTALEAALKACFFRLIPNIGTHLVSIRAVRELTQTESALRAEVVVALAFILLWIWENTLPLWRIICPKTFNLFSAGLRTAASAVWVGGHVVDKLL